MEGPAQAVMTAQQIPNAADLPQQPNNPVPYPGGVKPKKYHWYASRYLCLITALILLAFALRRLYTILERRYRRRTTPSRRPRWTSSVATALDAVTQRFLFLTTLPSWLYGPDTPADALCTTIYCSLMFYFALNHTTLGGNQGVANQMGVMAFSQLPLIILLIMKNNPISFLTGISYQKLNYLHRAASRACLICSWTHAIAWTPRVLAKGHFDHAYIIWGLVALFSFTMLWTTSFRLVRRVAWEFFILAHIVFSILFLVGAIIHWQRKKLWVWPSVALGLWAVDRLIRLCRLVVSNFCTGRRPNGDSVALREQNLVELLDGNVLRVTIRRRSFRWSAGQHAFLSFTSVTSSPHESHPFSLANIPSGSDNSAVFLIRVHSGATKLLRDVLVQPRETTIPIFIEGPYGAVHTLDTTSSVLLFAGGTGITFCLSHLMAIVDSKARGTTSTQEVRLVWHIRHQKDIQWIAPMLNLVAEQCTELPDFTVIVDCYVTRLPVDGQGNANERCSNSNLLDPENQEQPLLSTLAIGAGQSLLRYHAGRANIPAVVEQALSKTSENQPLNGLSVAVCGPHSLLLAVRKAVRHSKPSTGTRVEYYEETLGA